MQNRPRARKKFVSGQSSHSSGRGYSGGGYSGGTRGGGGGIIKLIILVVLLLGGGGGAIGGGLGDYLSGMMNGQAITDSNIFSGSGTQSGWAMEKNTGRLDTRVADNAREKYTKIKGLGKDKVTIMVYMCGTDLESRAGMATNDLNEMLDANISKKVDLIVYTGGCAGWKNSKVSSRYNQIWQVKSGSFKCLDKNAGTGSMTDPATLTSFIKWTSKNFPANRNELILWDHGGGSISGYGYDEKNQRSGSMNLAGIDRALSNAKVKFDFIGFDACLMATAETALMTADHADYLIASEETEPGIGWYYTNWLNDLSDDTSMSTLEIGRRIADDFTDKCAAKCPGQLTTLSVTDLAELSATLPSKLKRFSSDSSKKIEKGDYQEIATARSSSREFARSSGGIDQIDLAHFSHMTKYSSGQDLADTILDAVKYNRTSNNISNAYGLSIYFPLKKTNKVDSISKTYDEIGMDKEYTSCIKRFAQLGVAGQAVAGGTQSPLSSLFGDGSSISGLAQNASQLLNSGSAQSYLSQLFSGGRSIDRANIEGLDSSNTEFMTEDLLDTEMVADTVTRNRLTADDLKWVRNSDGDKVISLSEEKWAMISSIDMNMFYDNGSGYIDLGLDNVFEFDGDGNMLPDYDGTWIALNGQPVTYYHDETLEMGGGAYQITGHVPVMLNNRRADLILTFDNENEKGVVSGARYTYKDSTTETQAKAETELKSGDKIRFLYDFYSYKGKLTKDAAMGSTLYVTDPASIDISNVEVSNSNIGSGKSDNSKVTYKITDLFDEEYWTEELHQ